MAQFTLLTGATGLVGSYLMRDLLRNRHKLAVIVRCKEERSAAKRVDAILGECEVLLGERLARPVCLEGNVNHAHLGLSNAGRRWVARNCHRIIHNAAALKFKEADRTQDPWKTNYDGTRRVLNFCRRVGIRQLHYVSTAYVCGRRRGVILERELAEGQEFRNDYEHSKYLAEQLVQDDDFLEKPTIYRPVAIAGDSETGHTTSYHGVYVYLRFLSSLFRKIASSVDGKSSVPLRIALQGDERRNLVPVNWVAQVICHLVASPGAHGTTYHLAPRVPVTARLLLDAVYAYYSSDGLQFRGPDWDGSADPTILEAGFLAHSRVYRDYEQDDPEFDTKQLRRCAGHLPCPTIDRDVIQRYLQFGERDHWGKRSGAKPSRRAAA
jgi:thioester reductase-like protein